MNKCKNFDGGNLLFLNKVTTFYLKSQTLRGALRSMLSKLNVIRDPP